MVVTAQSGIRALALLIPFLIPGLYSATSHALPLWELKDTSNRISLLGSIHFLRSSDYPLDPAILKAFDDAEVVLMEIDMDDLDPVASSETIATLAMDGRGRKLPELLGPDAWQAASSLARELGLDLTPLAPFEPWYAAIVITQQRLAQLGFDPSLGIEANMAADARDEGKEIRGLETLESQLGTLDTLSLPAQRGFLQSTLEEAGEAGEIAESMITAWKSGDVKILNEELLGSVRKQREVYQALIIRRNENFARIIGGLVNDRKDYLIVIGALHLVGPDSVLHMLARDGIRAQQIDGR